MAKELTGKGRKRKIKTLLKMMNKQNKRLMPVTPPLVKLMDLSITDSELEFLILMGTDLFEFDQALMASEMDENSFEPFFETLKMKGLIHTEYRPNDSKVYRLNAIVVGWYEQMIYYLKGKPQEKRFSEIYKEYFDYFRRLNFFPVRNIQNLILPKKIEPNQDTALLKLTERKAKCTKSIPINQSISQNGTNVYPTYAVNEIIDNFGNEDGIYVFSCVCRHAQKLLDSECSFGQMSEVCFGFNNLGRSWAELGYGRKIDKVEALEILDSVRDQGAIHAVIHERDDPELPVVNICNCCWDCCGILKNYNMGAIPLKFNATYIAHIRADTECKGCGICEKFCPTTAISQKNGALELNSKLCIGCGQCAYQCPQNNIELCPDVRTVFLPILKRSEARVTA